MAIAWIDPFDPESIFPPVESALRIPDGLLAAGGDLNPKRLLQAYRQGIFPWYEEGQPILWWSPDPRAVLHTEYVKISRSLRKTLRNKPWTVSFDRAFQKTMRACAAPRKGSRGTWITLNMLGAYCRLHEQGYAHSVEVWDENESLIGGLYGVAIGRVFFGESMFSTVSDASKVAFVYLSCHLKSWGYPLIDCQLTTPHLTRLGAVTIPRTQFIEHLQTWCRLKAQPSPWGVDPDLDVIHWKPKPAVISPVN